MHFINGFMNGLKRIHRGISSSARSWLSRGSNIEHGATNFYAIHQSPEDMAETVSQAFLGLSIGCAKCHNHPLEKWTNDQYYAFANLFSECAQRAGGVMPAAATENGHWSR